MGTIPQNLGWDTWHSSASLLPPSPLPVTSPPLKCDCPGHIVGPLQPLLNLQSLVSANLQLPWDVHRCHLWTQETLGHLASVVGAAGNWVGTEGPSTCLVHIMFLLVQWAACMFFVGFWVVAGNISMIFGFLGKIPCGCCTTWNSQAGGWNCASLCGCDGRSSGGSGKHYLRGCKSKFRSWAGCYGSTWESWGL